MLSDRPACRPHWPGQKVSHANERGIIHRHSKLLTLIHKCLCLTKLIILIFLRNQKSENLKSQNICLILRHHHRMQKCLTARKKPSQDNKMYIFQYNKPIRFFRNVIMSCKLCPLGSHTECVMKLAEPCVAQCPTDQWMHITSREHVCQECIK